MNYLRENYKIQIKKHTLLFCSLRYSVYITVIGLHFFRFDVYSNFYFFRRKIKKDSKSIKPDLINLIGAENSYYSSSILDLKPHYPVLIFIQGFISQFKDEPHQISELKNRIKIEEKILKSFKYYCGEQDSSTYISAYNPDQYFLEYIFL